MLNIPQKAVFESWRLLNDCCYELASHDKGSCLVHIAKQNLERFNLVQCDVDEGISMPNFPKDDKEYDKAVLKKTYESILKICHYCKGYHNDNCYIYNSRKAIEILLFGKFTPLRMKTFGKFLLKKGIIDEDQITEAYSIQKKINISLPALALSKGFIDLSELLSIMKYSKKNRMDFLESSNALKYLTSSQIAKLVTIKKGISVYFGEILVMLGYLTEEDHGRMFDEFKRSR